MEEEIIFEIHPSGQELASLVKAEFENEEVLESNAFTGAEIITIILGTGKDAILKVLRFFSKHRESLKAASVKIGKDEVQLTGYSIKEVTEFIESGNVEKIITAIKNKKQ
jgi:hypothetical protein